MSAPHYLLIAAIVLSGGWARSAEALAPNELRYRLDRDGFVTLVIDDAQGQRVRNLVANTPRKAGLQTDIWDGLDDEGRPVAAGTYHWRGLVHHGITSHFAGAVYSPGNPPWVTSEVPAQWYVRPAGRGGWLADHAAPLCVAATGDRIFVGAAVAEAGHSVMELGPDGHKLWGTLWLGQAGANALAATDDILYVAGEGGWLGAWLAINRVDRQTHRYVGNPPAVQKQRTDICFVKEKQTDFAGIRGLAVAGRYLVLSLSDRGRLALFDRDTAAFVKDIPLTKPGGVISVGDQTVLAVSGQQVIRVNLTAGATQPVVTQDLVAPAGLATDGAGNLYVTDIAPTEQCLKVFAADGKFQRRLGRPGGRREGAFDPLAMANPTGVGVDGRGQVWVAENDYLPKRVSVWSADGQLIRDFVGPPLYGGGAALDPRVPGRAYHKGMIFDWRPWPEQNRLQAIAFRPELHSDLPFPMDHDHVPQFPAYRGDRCYLVQDAGWASGGVFIGELRENVLRPAVIFGDLQMLRTRRTDFPLPVNTTGAFLWQDVNGDGRATPDEVTVQPGWSNGAEWAIRAWPTLTLCARAPDGLKLIAPSDKADRLTYDLAQAVTVPLPKLKGINSLIVSPAGDVIINEGGQSVRGDRTNRLLSLDRQGHVRWTYPNPYPSNTHASPRPQPGDILHTLGFEGFAKSGETIFQLGANKGSRYLFTDDGLFIAETFPDIRVAPGLHSVGQVGRGQALEQYNLGDEVFGGWLGTAPDGTVYQILGKEHCSVFEVRGLNEIRRLKGGAVTITTPSPAAGAGGKIAVRPVEVLLGEIPHDWRERNPYALPSDRPLAWFALAADANALHLAIEVNDPTPFQNQGADIAELCRSGDAVDFRLATQPAGDQRFAVGLRDGQPVVVRYRYVVPGTTNPREFVSPTGRVTVDAIDVLPEDQATVRVERQAESYRLTLSLTWAALGLAARPSQTLRGDVGVIFSDPTGRRAVAREYYFDPASREVSDLPSEIRVNPGQWGELRF